MWLWLGEGEYILCSKNVYLSLHAGGSQESLDALLGAGCVCLTCQERSEAAKGITGRVCIFRNPIESRGFWIAPYACLLLKVGPLVPRIELVLRKPADVTAAGSAPRLKRNDLYTLPACLP